MDAPARPRRGYWTPAVIAMIALLGIGAAVGAGDLVHSTPRNLSGSDIASQIALDMQVQDRGASPPRVICPRSEPVKAGWAFSCQVGPAGSTREVKVVEVDRRGTLHWTVTP